MGVGKIVEAVVVIRVAEEEVVAGLVEVVVIGRLVPLLVMAKLLVEVKEVALGAEMRDATIAELMIVMPLEALEILEETGRQSKPDRTYDSKLSSCLRKIKDGHCCLCMTHTARRCYYQLNTYQSRSLTFFV